jgi:hypothetical protein
MTQLFFAYTSARRPQVPLTSDSGTQPGRNEILSEICMHISDSNIEIDPSAAGLDVDIRGIRQSGIGLTSTHPNI